MPNLSLQNEVYTDPYIFVAPTLAAARLVKGPTETPATLTPASGPFPLLCLLGGTGIGDQTAPKWYYWLSYSNAADNGTTVIAPTGLATGRWVYNT